MKKLLLILCVITLVGCSSNIPENNLFNGNVKEVKEYMYYACSKSKEPIAGEIVTTTLSEYDIANELIKISFCDTLGNVESINKFENDKNSKWSKGYFYYSVNGELSKKPDKENIQKYRYKKNMIISKSYEYTSFGGRKLTFKSEFDRSKMISTSYKYNDAGDIYMKYVQTYDDREYVIKTMIYDNNNQLMNESTYEYPKLDSMNNWIDKVQYVDGKPVIINKREIIYR